MSNEVVLKKEGDGNADDFGSDNADQVGGAGTKTRRRNVERHLAAERDRRRATKNKLHELDCLLPESSSGPRTLNQCLKLAAEHVGNILKNKGKGGESHQYSLISQVMDSSPMVGVAVLDKQWRFVRVNPVLSEMVSSPRASIIGMSVQSIVHPQDAQSLVDLLSRISRSSSPNGDKVFMHLRLGRVGDMNGNNFRSYKVDIVSIVGQSGDKVQMLMVYVGPSRRMQPNMSSSMPVSNVPGMLGQRMMELAQRLQILMGLDASLVSDIVNMMQPVTAQAGQVIISAGQSPGPLFVIDSGRCAVSVRGRQIAFLEAGECFGEISLLSGEPRTADVVAFTICNLFLIPALSILPIMQNNPLLMSKMQGIANSRLMREAGLWNHPSGLPLGSGPQLQQQMSMPTQQQQMQPQMSMLQQSTPMLQQSTPMLQQSTPMLQQQQQSMQMQLQQQQMPLQQQQQQPQQLSGYGMGNAPLMGVNVSGDFQVKNKDGAESRPFGFGQTSTVDPMARSDWSVKQEMYSSQANNNAEDVSVNSSAGGNVSSMPQAAPPSLAPRSMGMDVSLWPAPTSHRANRSQITSQDSIVQLLGEIAGEASEPIAGPWASDFADGVLDGSRVNHLNRSRTATPVGSHRSMSWDNFVRGECDFAHHLAPASPTNDMREEQSRPSQPSVDVERLQRAGVILSHCSSACKEDMAGRVRPVIANAGDVLIRQGVSGRSLFFIEHGSCEVQVDGQQVRTLSSGDCFGEVSLMMAEVTSAEVVAAEKSELLELSARDLWVLLSDYPELYTSLKRQAIENIQRGGNVDLTGWGDITGKETPGRNALEKLLKVMEDPPEISSFDALLVASTFCPYQTIVHAGATGDSLFFIDHGSVRVTNSGKEVARLNSGDFFGEVALMVSRQRTVDVHAITCVEVLEIKGPQMWKLLNGSPRLYNHLIRKAMASISNASGAFDSPYAKNNLLEPNDISKRPETSAVESLVQGVTELDKILHEEGDISKAKTHISTLRPLLHMLQQNCFR
mmetsp:Transcript_18466/g.60627  ORF Transcript_18466/g.60627 Transcript_18466/m.60627 type:complete len:1014 (-) Transcript_18466:36-3077(-)